MEKTRMNSWSKVIFSLAVAAFFTTLLPASEPVRKWRTKKGGEIMAKWDMANSTKSKIRLIRKLNGEAWNAEFDDLSDEDQRYVEERLKQERGIEITGVQPSDTDSEESDSYPEKPSRKIAFLVGTNEYDNLPKWEQLNWCVNDIRAVHKRLKEIGFADEDIISLENPTDTKIETGLKKLEEKIDEKDPKGTLVFLFFSGHGKNIKKESYYCPKNINKTHDLPHKVSVNDIIERIGEKQAFLKYFVFDMCRDSGDTPELVTLPKRTMVSFACCDGEKSAEVSELGHGLFCHFLLEGLRGNADTNADGRITLLELSDYISEKAEQKVDDFNKKAGGGLTLQHPEPKVNLGRVTHYPFLTFKEYGVKRTKKVDGIDYTFCWCPAGEVDIKDDLFTLTSLRDNRSAGTVNLPGFWILESEVTQQMWQSIMDESRETVKQRFSSNKHSSKDQTIDDPNAPMGCVSFEEARTFCNRLGNCLSEQVELPDQAKWTHASSSGVEGGYSNKINEMAWFFDNSGLTMHKVKTRLPNAWGIYDMFGNVAEWCKDDYDGTSKDKVTKGGGWISNGTYCTPGSNKPVSLKDNLPYLGFRPVLIPTGNEFLEGYLNSDPRLLQVQ